MKEVELTGETVEEIYEKLENNNGKQIRQHLLMSDTSIILGLTRFCKFTCPTGDKVVKLFVRNDRGVDYELNISPTYPEDKYELFLLVEEETTETFDQIVRRKQEEIFQSLK